MLAHLHLSDLAFEPNVEKRVVDEITSIELQVDRLGSCGVGWCDLVDVDVLVVVISLSRRCEVLAVHCDFDRDRSGGSESRRLAEDVLLAIFVAHEVSDGRPVDGLLQRSRGDEPHGDVIAGPETSAVQV